MKLKGGYACFCRRLFDSLGGKEVNQISLPWLG